MVFGIKKFSHGNLLLEQSQDGAILLKKFKHRVF
jgi:hypothetical protein